MDIYQFFLSLYKILLVKHNVDTIALKLPAEFEDQYVKEVIYNRSLSALPGEEWKTVEDFPNYAISSFGSYPTKQKVKKSRR